ncbi:MAG: hypothetical protein HY589_04090 [Candidatus Omnitrophica bacterium]|nr:hypothetical protein [Candidatus Omnitrophota bacterium]
MRNTRDGLTLIEVLISAAVLAGVLVSVISVYMICFELTYTSRNMTFAVNGAQLKMEEIRDHDFYKINDDYNNADFTVRELPAGANRGVIYVDNSNPDLLEVAISVSWREHGRVIGEDLDFDGVLDTGEDKNGNGFIDSTVQVVSLIAAR